MANEAYRAVFLRVHPTGKMVLSLTTESDGQESTYAQLVADELGVPALDVKVVPADTSRFGDGHGFNTAPSDGTSAAVTSATDQDPRQGAAARGRGARRTGRQPAVGQRRVRRGAATAATQDDRRHRAVRARHRRPAARRRGRPRRADRLPRLIVTRRNAHARTRERKADGPHAQGRGGRQGGPRPRDRGRPRWQGTLHLGDETTVMLRADARSMRVREGSGGMTSLGDDDKANIEQTIDDEVLKGTPIEFRSTRVRAQPGGRSHVACRASSSWPAAARRSRSSCR